MHWERRREKGRLCLFLCVAQVYLCTKVCWSPCTRLRTLMHGSLASRRCMCACAFSCVCVSMHDKEMDIYISSWLLFPGLSLMALCSGAELLLPTYFMTSCAPHANNSTSPLSTIQRLPSLTLSAYFSSALPLSASFFYYSLFLFAPSTGWGAKDSTKLNGIIK